jgi:hypothetical protein
VETFEKGVETLVSRRRTDPEVKITRHRPATTPEGRENQLISLATDLAEKRLREGTATGAEVVHLLRLGSSREKLEQERLRRENDLLEAKAAAVAASGRLEELVQNAFDAMRSYSGLEPDRGDDDEV